MKCARDQLLSRSSLAENQDSRVGRSNSLYILKRSLESRAGPNNLLEVVFGANLFLKIELFFLQSVFKRVDLAISQRIFNRNRHLLAHRGEQLGILLGERIVA